MTLEPMYDKVVVEQADADDKTKGGLILTEAAKEKPKKGTVIATGPGLLLQDGTLANMPLAVGDVVLFTPYGGNEIEVDDKKYMVLSASEVLAVIRT